MKRTPGTMARRCLWGLAAAATAGIAILAGCATSPTEGYSTDPPFPSNVGTVSVSIFENKTYVRDIQFDIADALIKQIESTTPYKVTGAGTADTALTGRITSVTLRQLSKSTATGLAEEDVLVVTVDFEWRDLRTGRPIVERSGFTADGLFVPSRPSAEPIELGRFAAAQAMATDIVGEMRSAW